MPEFTATDDCLAMAEQEIHQLDAFRVIVLRVIESFVHKSLDDTISLTKIASVINTTPRLLELRRMMHETTPQLDCTRQVTIRDVVLSITKTFDPSQIHILEDEKDFFILRLTREQFQGLIRKVYNSYRDEVMHRIRDDEKEYNKLQNEITLIEKGELDNLIISEFGAPVVKAEQIVIDDGDTKTETRESKTSVKDDKKRVKEEEEEQEEEEQPRKKAKLEAGDAPQDAPQQTTEEPTGALPPTPNKKLQVVSNALIASISSHKYASTFLQPVNESSAPEYYSLIKQPRDLKTIKQMVKDGRLQSGEELEREILLMFANAIMYNRTGRDIYKWAKEMQVDVDKTIDMLRET